MDSNESEKLVKLVKSVTETGKWTLDPSKLKLIKSFCKRSDYFIQIAFESIYAQLKKKHAQIRYSSLQLIEQLFERSSYFRDLLTEDFPFFTQLTVGLHDQPLPPPQQVATKLKVYAMTLMKSWFEKYGDKYRQISMAYDFLKKMEPPPIIHAKNTRTKRSHRHTLLMTPDIIKDLLDNIQENLATMEGCFEILVPKHVGDDLDFEALLRGEEHQTATYKKEDIVAHGLGSNRYTIEIDFSSDEPLVEETEDNKIVFDQLREAYTLLETKHSKQLNRFIDLLEQQQQQELMMMKKMLDVKAKVTEMSHKAKLLHIDIIHREEEEEDEFEDELFEDVQVPEFTSYTHQESSKLPPPIQRIFPLAHEPTMVDDVTYNSHSIIEENMDNNKGKQKMTPQREELLKRAPFVEWGDDLYYWDKKSVQFNTSGLERSHRFMGVGEGTNEIPNHLLDQLRRRPIYYETESPKTLQACKYPLKNGGLCPRKDLKICPFHGRIIPRDDEHGRPLNQQHHQDTLITDDNNIKKPDPLSHHPKKRQRVKKSELINVRKKPTTTSSYDRILKRG